MEKKKSIEEAYKNSVSILEKLEKPYTMA